MAPHQKDTKTTEKKQIFDQLRRPLRDLRISVIDTCNFRCLYCMPPERDYNFLRSEERLSFAEIEYLVELFARFGVKKVRITGGEPLLRPDLSTLIRSLKQISGIEDISLTTNGWLLEKSAEELKKSGLDRITVSLDTVDANLFHKMTGGKGELDRVLRGIEKAVSCNLTPLKINVVVQKEINDSDLCRLVEQFRHEDIIVRFIEFMDVGKQNDWKNESVVTSSEILKRMGEYGFKLIPAEPNYFGEVASRYVFEDGPGEIGFISSVSQPFCRTCTRARLSTDGKLFTCLFASEGIDFKHALRNGASKRHLMEMIQNSWENRFDKYSEDRQQLRNQHKIRNKIEMFQIGG